MFIERETVQLSLSSIGAACFLIEFDLHFALGNTPSLIVNRSISVKTNRLTGPKLAAIPKAHVQNPEACQFALSIATLFRAWTWSYPSLSGFSRTAWLSANLGRRQASRPAVSRSSPIH